MNDSPGIVVPHCHVAADRKRMSLSQAAKHQATPEAACLCKLMLASKDEVFGRLETLDVSAQNTTVSGLRPPSCEWYTAKIKMPLYMRLSDVRGAARKKKLGGWYLHVAFKECRTHSGMQTCIPTRPLGSKQWT
jgi:hypothetical protein